MNILERLGPDVKIIDLGAADPSLAFAFAESGSERYLGLVAAHRLLDLRRDAGPLAHRFHPLTATRQSVGNNADLLILRRGQLRHLWHLPDLRHLTYLAVERAWDLGHIEASVPRLAGRMGGLLTSVGCHRLGGSAFDVFRVATRLPSRPRFHLSEVWGVDGLAARLDAASVRYVVLRWFEGLPHLDPGDDIDLLVADDDLGTVRALLGEEPGTLPVDVYSESGIDGSDRLEVACYPPALASGILRRAVVHANGYRVPAPEDHLLSLAYHAIYHKGLHSGLPSSLLPTDPRPAHDYAGELKRLGAACGIELPETMEEIDERLAGLGWRPSLDALLRESTANAWVAKRFFPAQPAGPPSELPEPAVFFVRARAAEVLGLDAIARVLERRGFELLVVRDLDEPARTRCAAGARGGNWQRGPWPADGGPPVAIMLVLHSSPSSPSGESRLLYPRLSNAEVLAAKTDLRALVRATLPSDEHFNPVHTSDNELEVWEYLRLALPADVEELRSQIAARRARYRTHDPVRREVHRGRRSKVEIVTRDGHPMIRKTFVPGHEHLAADEVAALRDLVGVAGIPDNVTSGEGWLAYPIDGHETVWSDRRLLPLRLVHAMVDVVHQIHDRGYALVDVRPESFLLDSAGRLTVAGFEMIYRYPGTPPPLASSFSFDGAPWEVADARSSYDARWRQRTGLSLEALLEEPPWSQRVRRLRHAMSRVVVGPHSSIHRLAAAIARSVRTARPAAVSRYRRWANSRASAGASLAAAPASTIPDP